jgi:hypothetical protein
VQEVKRVQRLVGEHGRLGAISRVEHEERRLVEIVAGYGTDEDVGMPAFLYSGWCLTALPHSRIPDADAWELNNGALTLLVEPGRRVLPGGGTEFVGVPYGATARLLLVYLQTQALRTGSRRIELGGSMKAWFDRLEKTPGGKSYRLVKDQAERIAMAKFSFHSEKAGVRAVRNTVIVEEGLLFADSSDSRQQTLFREGVVLSESFFNALKEHAVPLEERALRHIRSSSLAIDAYAWLAFRLRSLKKPTPIGWASLHAQFGRGYGQRAAFKRAFRKALKDALAVYPEAADGGVEETDSGLLLRQVRPPILERVA